MYAWLWRQLPGPVWVRMVQALVLVALVGVVLFAWVYPAAAAWLEPDAGVGP